MATEILRPNANGDTVQFTPMVPGEGEANWENVDEAESDGFDTLNVQTEASEEYDLYALPNHSEGSGTINKITVHYKIWNNAEGNTDKAIIKTGGTIYSGDVQNSEVEDWSVHSQIWETNPDTGYSCQY